MRIPIVITGGNFSNDGLLLCQFADSSVVTQGESGAIGRVSIGDSSIKFDIKGKQYSGAIYPTFTTMLISNPRCLTLSSFPSQLPLVLLLLYTLYYFQIQFIADFNNIRICCLFFYII